MNLNQIKYFSAICQCGSITKASEKLHISQPALSSSIRELENEFSVELLSRSKGHIVITKAGQLFLERCERILEEISETEFIMRLQKESVIHDLRLGVPPMTGAYLIPDIHKALPSYFPNINIIMYEQNFRDCTQKIIDREIDYSFVPMTKSCDNRLARIQITSHELCFCVNEQHPLGEKEIIDLNEIGDYPIVNYYEGSFHHGIVAEMYKKVNLQPNVVQRSNRHYVIEAILRENPSYAAFLLKECITPGGGLKIIPLKEPIRIGIGLIWRKDAYFGDPLNRFPKFLQELFE